jgi:daunorubicin resistance ABC transporter membrane protein
VTRDLATVAVLWRRDVVRFFRQRSRVIGALLQPLIFWLVIGGGLDRAFAVPGAEGVGYREYFFPGVVMMVVLFTSIFSTMSLIEDRHAGFLQAVLVAPSRRVAIVLGKTLGGVTVALAQAACFLALAPAAGYELGAIDWPMVAAALVLSSIALCALGFAIAWWLDSQQGYHAVMSVLLLPAWILSGAMFPASRVSGWMEVIMRGNPLGWAMDALRAGLGPVPEGLGGGAPPGVALAAVAGFAVATLALASAACARRA